MERAIIDAVRAGLHDVARVLAARLDARRTPSEVIDLGRERERRR